MLFRSIGVMLVKFGIKNSEGKENITAIDINKASQFAYKLDMQNPTCWRLAGVVIEDLYRVDEGDKL